MKFCQAEYKDQKLSATVEDLDKEQLGKVNNSLLCCHRHCPLPGDKAGQAQPQGGERAAEGGGQADEGEKSSADLSEARGCSTNTSVIN